MRNSLQRLNADKNVLLYITFGFCLLAVCIYLKDIGHILGTVGDMLKPVMFGFLFAYVLNVLMRFLEKKLLDKLAAKNRHFAKVERPLAILLSFLVVLVILSLFFVIVLPQFIVSLTVLAKSLPGYAEEFAVWAGGVFSFYHLDSISLTDLAGYASQLISYLTELLQNAVPNILGFTVSVANGFLNVVFGIIFAVYMLAGKEKLSRQFGRFIDSFFPEKICKKARYVVTVSDEVCSHFIEGQCLDALCLGILSFIVLSIMQMPYALVISVTLAITNMIPVVGPWLGAIPCAVITLVISPVKALILVITIIVLQEIENKLIYPRIVGGRIGLDGIWVLFGVVCGGELFGLAGIILGVPVVGVGARVLGDAVKNRLGADGEKNG